MLNRFRILCLAGILNIGPSLAHADPTQQPLVQRNNISYLGSFKVPKTDSSNEPLTYGGHALGYNPVRNSLYFGCHDWYQKLAEVSIPNFGGTATILQNCTDVTEGELGSGPSVGNKLGGNFVYNNRLITTGFIYYDASGTQTDTHGAGGLTFSVNNDFTGFYRFSGASAPPRALGGYMTPIPTEWQTLFGGPALTGQGSLSIVGNSSDGPSATVFDPNTIGVSPTIPGSTIINYPFPNGHPDFEAKGSVVAGMAFPNNSRTILFFGTRAQLPYCYGTPEECPGTCGSSKGPHNQFKHAIWAYDANDLLRVKRGEIQSYQATPYAVWEFSEIDSGNCASTNFGGATFDQQNGILYVTETVGEDPAVHAFRIAVAAPPPVALCPTPAGMTTVNVSNITQLRNAISGLQNNTEIRIAAGTYNLTDALWLPQGRSNITIRGATGNRDDVILQGRGMTDSSVPHGIWMENVTNALIADLTIRDVFYHPISLGTNSEAPIICNVRMINAGEQFIKGSSGGSGVGVDNGVIKNCLMEYETTAKSNYTNGVDIHTGRNWVIQDNVFRNIRAPAGQGLAGPAILMWNGSRDTIVERNTLVNCQMGIALGLIQQSGFSDHTGGIIRNNIIHRKSGESGDVGILVWESPNTKVLNNTIILSGTYGNAIEYRFAETTGVEIRNNLSDGGIVARDGATGTVANNVTNAQLSWFVNAANSDLHLVSGASNAIDKASVHASVTDDIDKNSRGATPDMGADEFGGSTPPPPPPPPTNQAPSVNAGPDRTITLPAFANLDGTVADDGLPNPPAAVTRSWTKVSGPGNVTFGNANATDTTATFSSSGTYVLRLTASDSSLSANDTVSVTVNSQPAGNQPPAINAGGDQAITLSDTATLDGTMVDDGLPNPPGSVTVTWTKTSGPGTVAFGNINAIDTTASFSAEGTYVLRLTASDGQLSAFNEITVVVTLPSGPTTSPETKRHRLLAKPGQPAEVDCPNGCDITIYNRFGDEILKTSGSGMVAINNKSLPSGTYKIRIDSGDRKELKNMVIVR